MLNFFRNHSAEKGFEAIGLLILAGIIGVGALVYQVQQRQNVDTEAGKGRTPTVVLTLSVSNARLKPGEETTVDINIDTKTYSVAAADLQVNFDATKFDGVSFTQGTFLPVVLLGGNFSNGIAKISLGSQVAAPATGAGLLAHLKLRAKSAGQSQVSINTLSQIAAPSNSTPLPLKLPKAIRIQVQ